MDLNDDAIFVYDLLTLAVAVYIRETRRRFDGSLIAEVIERSARRRTLLRPISASVAHLPEPADLIMGHSYLY
jgi:hypothetical protein